MNGRRPRSLFAVACASLAGCDVGDHAAPPSDETAGTTVRLEPQMGDAMNLYRLGLMRGHLLVGNALFELDNGYRATSCIFVVIQLAVTHFAVR